MKKKFTNIWFWFKHFRLYNTSNIVLYNTTVLHIHFESISTFAALSKELDRLCTGIEMMMVYSESTLINL